MKELIISLLNISCDIPRKEFGKDYSIYIFPKENKYIAAPHGQLTYYDPNSFIELPDNTDNKSKFMTGLLYAYWNTDLLEQISKHQIPNPLFL